MSLVTLAQVKEYAVIETDDFDSALLLRAEEATHIVIDYIKRPDHGWTDRTVPPLVRVCILRTAKILFDQTDEKPLDEWATGVLERFRDPALA